MGKELGQRLLREAASARAGVNFMFLHESLTGLKGRLAWNGSIHALLVTGPIRFVCLVRARWDWLIGWGHKAFSYLRSNIFYLALARGVWRGESKSEDGCGINPGFALNAPGCWFASGIH